MFIGARTVFPINNDLMLYWAYDGPVKTESRAPLRPYSREVTRVKWLKKTVAVYRLVLAQPRQDDIVDRKLELNGVVHFADIAKMNRGIWQ